MVSARHDLAQLLLFLMLSACSASHGDLDGGLGPADAARAPHDAATIGEDAGPPPVDDAGLAPARCDAEDARELTCPTAVCDGLDTWHWNGDSCFRIDCGTCVGADCSRSPTTFTQADCEAAHAGCAPTICRTTGGAWLWWAEECNPYICGRPAPAECFVGHAVCDCGPTRRYDAALGCVDDPTCPPPATTDREALCTATHGTWGGYCCDTICGELCSDPCVSPACDCGPGRVFDDVRGCVESTRCHERVAGETCEGDARCAAGTICCQSCGGAGCVGPHRCVAPVCDSDPFTDECGNDSRAP
jgi:hypothetical protein